MLKKYHYKQDFNKPVEKQSVPATTRRPDPIVMDLFLQSPFSFVSGLCALLIFIYFILERSPFYRKNSNVLPQAGGALPIIGHLHLLGGNQLTHKTLGAMADKFGPAFALKLGSHKALVVSSWEMARECFLTHDRFFPPDQVLWPQSYWVTTWLCLALLLMILTGARYARLSHLSFFPAGELTC